MKFVLVNHRTPLHTATCSECSQPLDAGYLREVSTQRQYCDHDCYLRYEARSLLTPWLNVTRTASRHATPYAAGLQMMTSFAAASCWYSISLAKASLRMAELVATELSEVDRERK